MGQPGCNSHSLPRWNSSSSGYSCNSTCNKEFTKFRGEKITKDETDPNQAVWKTDGEHITFYASTLNCIGSTIWCIDHCLSKTKPFPFDIRRITPKYSIKKLTNGVAIQPFKADFLAATYVTLMGTGTLEVIDKDVSKVIEEIPKFWKDKFFRLFIRTPLPRITKIRKNVKVIFSIDKDTKIEFIDWATRSKAVSAIGIVNHIDNRITIDYLRSKISQIIDCKKCTKRSCFAFKGKRKRLVLLNYIY